LKSFIYELKKNTITIAAFGSHWPYHQAVWHHINTERLLLQTHCASATAVHSAGRKKCDRSKRVSMKRLSYAVAYSLYWPSVSFFSARRTICIHWHYTVWRTVCCSVRLQSICCICGVATSIERRRNCLPHPQ